MTTPHTPPTQAELDEWKYLTTVIKFDARDIVLRLITEVERLRVAPITFCFCPRCGVQMNPKHDTSEVDSLARLTKEVEELRSIIRYGQSIGLLKLPSITDSAMQQKGEE